MMPAKGLDKLNRRNPRQRLVGIPVFTPYRRQLAVRAPGTVAPAQLAFDTQQAGINVVVAVLGTQNIVVHLVYPDRRTPVPVVFPARQADFQLVVFLGVQARVTHPTEHFVDVAFGHSRAAHTVAGHDIQATVRRVTPLTTDKATDVVIIRIGVGGAILLLVSLGRTHRHHGSIWLFKHVGLVSLGGLHLNTVVTNTGTQPRVHADLVEGFNKHTHTIPLNARPHVRGHNVFIHVVQGGIPVVAFHIYTDGNVFGVVDGLIQHQSHALSTGLRGGQHFHGSRLLAQTEVVHHMVNVRLPDHQVPAAIGNGRTQLHSVQVGVGFRRVHTTAQEADIPLFLAANHAFDIEAVISCPGAIHPAFGVFVGAADFVTVAVFVVVGFVVAAGQSNEGILATGRYAAVHQLAFTVIGTTNGQMACRHIVIGKFRCGRGRHHLAAGNRTPAQGAVAGAHFQHRRQRRAQTAGGRVHAARAGAFHPHAVQQYLNPLLVLATDYRVQATATHTGQRHRRIRRQPLYRLGLDSRRRNPGRFGGLAFGYPDEHRVFSFGLGTGNGCDGIAGHHKADTASQVGLSQHRLAVLGSF